MKKEDVNILLVDDEEMIVEQLSHYLTSCGFSIDGESDPNKAVEMVKSKSYDMVITDLKMPQISGMDIIKLVKETNKDALILIITGFATTDSAIEAIQYGVYDYIRKPFRFTELEGVVNRAAEKIILKRENEILNERIKRMLNYVTTLFDISSLLYQINDFNEIINMILDTITEGLKIEKVAILLGDKDDHQYVIHKSRGLNGEIKHLTLESTSKINDTALKEHEPTMIKSIGKELQVNGRRYEMESELTNCIFLPISFRNRLLGYFCVFDMQGQYLSIEDELKLLKILATQTAPIFISQNIITEKDDHKTRDLVQFTQGLIEDSILESKQKNRSVYFLQLKVIPRGGLPLETNYENLHQQLDEIINSEITKQADIVWQNFDSVFIVLFESTPVEAEMTCANIRTKVEDLYSADNNNPVLSINYTIAAYPKDGETFTEIINSMKQKYYSGSTDFFVDKPGDHEQGL